MQSNIYTCEDSGKTSNQAVLLRALFSSSLFFFLFSFFASFCGSFSAAPFLHWELQLQRKIIYKATEMELVTGCGSALWKELQQPG